MLAIIEQWEVGTGCHKDNTENYVILLLFKLGLDSVAFYLCCRKWFASFMSVCSLSIVLADLVLALALVAVWSLGPDKPPVPLCFLLANASATYGALPLPMMVLGLLDYWLYDTYLRNHSASSKNLINIFLTLLVWMQALIYSFCFVHAELTELDNIPWVKALVCEVEESTVITYFTLLAFTVVLCAALPFLSSIPQWLREADRLCEKREEQEDQKSDFLFISINHAEQQPSEDCLVKPLSSRPPLWLSLMLGFAVFWLPYLTISVVCMLFGLGVPAYITVNILWLECANSLVMGVVFWTNRDVQVPYCSLPENVCLWHIYWHLSKGTGQQQLPIAVFNPSKAKRETLFYV